MNSYIYTFVRQDLSPEQRIVQIGHACYEAGKKFQDDLGVSNLVLLSVENEDELTDIAFKLDMRGIGYYMFYENDINSYTAICTVPVIEGNERSFFKKYKLYSEETIPCRS